MWLITLKIIELFAGIGAPRRALQLANIDHKVVWFCELDKYAEKSYRAIYNDYETPNLGDITKIDVNNLQKEEIDLNYWRLTLPRHFASWKKKRNG